MNNVKIDTEYITLGQFLKFTTIAQSGGMVKAILQDYKISVNDVEENRRGKKLYPGDKITVRKIGDYRIVRK